MKTLKQRIDEINAEAEKFIYSDPEKWMWNLVGANVEMWEAMGITTAEQLDEHRKNRGKIS